MKYSGTGWRERKRVRPRCRSAEGAVAAKAGRLCTITGVGYVDAWARRRDRRARQGAAAIQSDGDEKTTYSTVCVAMAVGEVLEVPSTPAEQYLNLCGYAGARCTHSGRTRPSTPAGMLAGAAAPRTDGRICRLLMTAPSGIHAAPAGAGGKALAQGAMPNMHKYGKQYPSVYSTDRRGRGGFSDSTATRGNTHAWGGLLHTPGE